MRPKSSTPETPSERSDGCELDEGEVVGCEFVVSRRDAPTLLDLVEEPFDQIARAIQIRAEADRLLAIRSAGSHRCTLLAEQRPSIRPHHILDQPAASFVDAIVRDQHP